MQAQSQPVTSSQQGIHSRLPALLKRYRSHSHRKPVAKHNLQAFKLLEEEILRAPRPMVLDSFCGTGLSTAALAERHPDHLVLGIDQSAHRLGKHEYPAADNYLLIQAQCEDIWRLMLQAGLKVDFHYLLYPNPWPKPGQIQRRVHGNAAFQYLLGLGGQIELRSNWQIYVEEFGVAMHLSGQRGLIRQLVPDSPLTLFEKKYQGSGHQLWSYTGTVSPARS